MKHRFILSGMIALAAMIGLHAVYALVVSHHMKTTFIDRGPNLRKVAKPLSENADRMIARRVSDETASDLMGLHAKEILKLDTMKPQILIAGSSLSYGYAARQDASLSGAMNRTFEGRAAIANISVVGRNINTLSADICRLAAHGLKSDIIILEVPIVNEVRALNRDYYQVDPRIGRATCPSESAKASGSYLSYFFKNPWGVHAPKMLSTTFADRAGTIEITPSENPPESYTFTAEKIKEEAVAARARLETLVDIASLYEAKIVMIGSPVYRPAFDRNDLGEMLDAYDVIWKEVCAAANAICIDPSSSFEKKPENYFNITHLNRHGSEVLAMEIIDVLEATGFELPETVPFEAK